MKQFKYFTSQNWVDYVGPYLYQKLKKRYRTNKAISQAFEHDASFETCKAVTGLKVSYNMSGKMEGIKCITSACTANDHCKKLHKSGGICEHCYAFKYLNMRPTVRKCYERNSKALSNEMDVAYMPTFRKGEFVRLESFGDLINRNHIENYLLICFKNPDTNFALFTKRRFMLENYFKNDVKKPKNLAIVSSAYAMNDYKNTELYASYDTNDRLGFKLIDTMFNVYTSDDQMQKKDKLALRTFECEKQCQSCLACWNNTTDDIMLVKEHLK